MLSTFTFVFVFITNGHLLYSLPLLVLYPKYKCLDDSITCDHHAYCEDKTKVQIDWDDEWSLHNWVQRFSLECVEPYRIAMLGTLTFVGSTLMGIFVTRLGDIYGRKIPTMISSIMAVPILACILYSKNLYLTTILFFVMGSCGPGKTFVGFVYAGEMFPEKYRSIIGSIMLFTDSATMIILPLYFKFISKNWLYLQLFYFILSFISSLCLFLIPESPKYLLSKGLYS